MTEDWPDFGPGHLPTSLSQGIESENILKLWDRLNDDNRTILEETLRKLPMSHFIWFEKLLDYLKYRFGEPWMTGDRYLFRCLVPSSSPALFKIYLRILTTPGREPGRLQHQNWYNPPISHNAWWHEWCDWRMSLNLDANANSHLADVDVNSDTEWLQLQKAVQELPIDINRMIRDSVHEIVFGPKDVVLPYVDPNDLRHFSALNSELWTRRRDWAMLPKHVSARPESAIRNVTIRWTRGDIDDGEWSKLELDHFMETHIDEGGAEGLDNMQALRDYSYARKNVSEELKLIWVNKAMDLRPLDLDLLVVDAVTAYGPEGEYLGLEVARDFPRFHWHCPYQLEVWAPDEDLANQIYEVIIARQ